MKVCADNIVSVYGEKCMVVIDGVEIFDAVSIDLESNEVERCAIGDDGNYIVDGDEWATCTEVAGSYDLVGVDSGEVKRSVRDGKITVDTRESLAYN